MTIKRRDKFSTEFELWTREQKELDSIKEFIVCSNVDYLWRSYLRYEWMFIEEKRHQFDGSEWKDPFDFPGGRSQKETFNFLKEKICLLKDKKYYGFHLLQFENTTPDDGMTRLYPHKLILTRDELVKFLKFEKPYEDMVF